MTIFCTKWLKDRNIEEIRGNPGRIWPTDPRHSWWKRNRCYGSPEDFHALTQGSESEAQILPSETSCPPLQEKKGETWRNMLSSDTTALGGVQGGENDSLDIENATLGL